MIYNTSDIHGYPLDDFLRLLEKAGLGDDGVAMLRWIMARPNAEE